MQLNFEDKRKALFDSLESAEKTIITGTSLEQEKDVNYCLSRDGNKSERSKIKSGFVNKFRGKESIFKRPDAPISKCLKPSRTPDYQANPHKWTKYSLEDVDTSDRSNTVAAYSFLREIETQKQNQDREDGETRDLFRSKVKFNKSIKLKQNDDEEPSNSEKPSIKGSKTVMPEYVIGQKIKKDKKKIGFGSSSSKKGASTSIPSSRELKLDHLLDGEDEGEEDDDNDDRMT